MLRSPSCARGPTARQRATSRTQRALQVVWLVLLHPVAAFAAPPLEPPGEAPEVQLCLMPSALAADWPERARGQLSELVGLRLTACPHGDAGEGGTQRPANSPVLIARLAVMAPSSGRGASQAQSAQPGTYLVVEHTSPDPYLARLNEPWRKLNQAERSATLEAAALRLRSLVRASLLSPRAEPDTSRLRAAPAPADGPPDFQTATKPRPPAAPPRKAPRGARPRSWPPLGIETRLGVSLILSGIAPTPTLAVHTGAGLLTPRWRWLALANYRLPYRLDVAAGSIALHGGDLEVASQWSRSAFGGEVALGGALGLAALHRRTLPDEEELLAAESRWLLSGSLSALLEYQWQWAPRARFALLARAQLLLPRNRYRLRSAVSDRNYSYVPWAVQPSLTLVWAPRFLQKEKQ